MTKAIQQLIDYFLPTGKLSQAEIDHYASLGFDVSPVVSTVDCDYLNSEWVEVLAKDIPFNQPIRARIKNKTKTFYPDNIYHFNNRITVICRIGRLDNIFCPFCNECNNENGNKFCVDCGECLDWTSDKFNTPPRMGLEIEDTI